MYQHGKPEKPEQNQPAKNRPGQVGGGWSRRLIRVLFLLIAVLPWLWFLYADGADKVTEISYSAFRQHLQAGNVEQITVKGQRIRGTFKEPLPQVVSEEETATYPGFVTYLPSFGDEALLPYRPSAKTQRATGACR